MFRRCAALVSALALFTAFLSAPYDHVHTSTDVRHSHVTPHDGDHQHGTPDGPDHTRHGQDDTLKADMFMAPVPGATPSIIAVIVSSPQGADLERATHDADPAESRAHDPPTAPRSPRAPPVLPAF